ncbi:peptidylprolyl isomerase [Pedobacter sp. HMF7056]|uniref:Peptidyl-prolyl cis-trans isomerase n=2 Tax=Hufsiella ginkgonis TaxID=2695274 RepID=A0A7K1Y1I8_9SPHI|nr:peptidylprolyl isomerase [Hufsiella ginkgonis]
MRRFILFAFVITLFSAGCAKEDQYDAAKQLVADEVLIKDFIAKNNITAVRHSTGLYYTIINPGSGSYNYTTNTVVNVKYTGTLLNGQLFDSATTGTDIPLGQVIDGWQIGIPLIQKGGKIRLIIPSPLGYRNMARGSIPANSVMDFTVELLDVKN